MQLPLTKSPLLRAGTLCVAGLALSAALAPHNAHAQSRRAKTSASRAKAPASTQVAKIRVLQARRRKAIAIYNAATQARNSVPVFTVYGKIESGNLQRLVIYGKSIPENEAARSGLGTNSDDNFLIIYNANPNSINYGRYQGVCGARSQTEFSPMNASYFEVEGLIGKYEEVIGSIDQEIAAQENIQVQTLLQREEAKRTGVQDTRKAQQESVYRARVALADKEVDATMAQLNHDVALVDNKDSAYLQSSAAAMALYNKWGNLGVANRPLLWRTFDDLAQAAAWQVERGDWTGAGQTSEKLLSLEVFGLAPKDAKTGRQRTELGVDAAHPQMPSNAVSLVMHRNGRGSGGEPVAAAKLARAWLSRLPAYIAGLASREEKLRVAKLSQLLGAEVFAGDAGRTQTIALAVDALRGTYGPGALSVLSEYVPAVDAAKRQRVARQVAAFSSPLLPYRAPDNQGGAPNAPVEAPRVTQTFEDTPPQDAPVDALPPVTPADTPQAPATPEEVEKPVEKPIQKPLVPAVDFVMRSYLNARKVRLSDFRGKTVLLHFWNLPNEEQDMSPTPVEKLFALTKRYDPKKIVLVLVSEGGSLDLLPKEYRELTDPTPDPERDRDRGHGPRLYPQEAFSLVMGSYAGSPGFDAAREVANQALGFYASDKNGMRRQNRVTVISPAGQVVGTLDYKRDLTATEFNDGRPHPTGASAVYDFDEAALEDLLVRAMGAQP